MNKVVVELAVVEVLVGSVAVNMVMVVSGFCPWRLTVAVVGVLVVVVVVVVLIEAWLFVVVFEALVVVVVVPVVLVVGAGSGVNWVGQNGMLQQ